MVQSICLGLFFIEHIYISTDFFYKEYIYGYFKRHNLDYCNNNIITTKTIKYMKFIGACHVRIR